MKLVQEGFDAARNARDEAVFHTANGYLGVRACPEGSVPEGVPTMRGTYLNGFYDLKPMVYTERLHGFPTEQETMLNVADSQRVTLFTEQGEVSPFFAPPLSYQMELDMAAGLVRRRMLLRVPEGGTLDVEICRMASLAQQELFVLRYRVTSVDYAGTLTFLSSVDGRVTAHANPNDPRVSQIAQRHLLVRGVRRDAAGQTLMICDTGHSGLSMACAVWHRMEGEVRRSHLLEAEAAIETFQVSLSPGDTAVLEKWCVYCDSRRTHDPAAESLRILADSSRLGLDAWFQRQRCYLDDFWAQARVELQGNGALQTAMDYALYQLLQAAGRDAISGVAAKGLSGEGYEGHSFWDTEIYIFPFFLLTHPQQARNLLRYRYGLLDAARAHAHALGHKKGALYPWRTITGRECSGYFPSGSAQYHINGDIAHAFSQYWHLTGDLPFMAAYGAEVLVETARLWMDVGHFAEDGFRIDAVTGPDEYTCIVNNNYYTNLSAMHNLLDAVEICETLQEAGQSAPLMAKLGITGEELSDFRRAAAQMYLPADESLGILAQDDSFLRKEPLDLKTIPSDHFPLLLHYHPLFLYRHQVLKQADTVLAMLLYEHSMPKDMLQRTYLYYEALTTHDSSLSPCVYGMVASCLGDLPKAEHYFMRTARLDLDDTHGNTADGLHIANLGGVYLGAIMGFAGLRITEKGVSLRPCLPSFLAGYAFRFQVGKSVVRFALSRGAQELSLVSGRPVTVTLNDSPILVS